MFTLMGNCIQKCTGKKEPTRELTFAILGLDNAGKTVTTKGLQGEAIDSIAPTVGFSHVEFTFDKTRITLFDLGGGRKIRGIWANYLSELYGIIYVVDSSESERMEESREVLQDLLKDPYISGKPLLLLANKQDVPGALDEIDVCEQLDLEELVNIHKVPCRVETCSALLGQGKKLDKSIKQGISWLISTVDTIYDELHERIQKDMAKQKEKDAKERAARAERVRKIREEREKEKERLKEEGFVSEEEDEDSSANGAHPFQQLDVKQLEAQRIKEKEKKMRKKEAERRLREREENMKSDEEPPRSSRKKKNKYHQMDSDGEEEETRSSRFSKKSPRFNKFENEESSLERRLSLKTDRSPRSARDGSSSPPRSRSDLPALGRLNGYSLGGGSDDETLRNNRSPWLKKRSPRPNSPNLPPPMASHLSSRLPDLHGADELDMPAVPRRGLMHLSPLDPIENYEDSSKKKKKRKKKTRRNQTAPSDDDADNDEGSERSQGWGRNMARASRTPRLEPLQEPDNENESFSARWGLADDLPELPERKGPNTDYYDDLVT